MCFSSSLWMEYMRQLITILLFTLSFISFGQQKLNGTYRSPSSYVYNSLTFKSDSLFEYSFGICELGRKGNGIFKIKNDKLILNFTDEDSVKNYFKVSNTNCNTVDSITLNFVVIDMTTDDTIPFPAIWITDSKNETIKTLGNIDGIAKIKVKKSTLKSEINVRFTFYTSFSFRLNMKTVKTSKSIWFLIVFKWKLEQNWNTH